MARDKEFCLRSNMEVQCRLYCSQTCRSADLWYTANPVEDFTSFPKSSSKLPLAFLFHGEQNTHSNKSTSSVSMSEVQKSREAPVGHPKISAPTPAGEIDLSNDDCKHLRAFARSFDLTRYSRRQSLVPFAPSNPYANQERELMGMTETPERHIQDVVLRSKQSINQYS